VNILDQLAQTVLSFFHVYELPTLFFAILIEEAGIPIPIPGDALVMLAGAEPHTSLQHAVAAITVSSLAVFLGSSVLYAVMRRGGNPLLVKYGKYVHLHEQRVYRIKSWLEHRGRVAIIVGRLIPGLRIPTTVLAGTSGVAYREYAVTAAIAAVVWSCFYYAVGGFLGQAAPVVWAIAADAVDDIPRWLVVVGLCLLTIGAVSGWQMRKQIRRRLVITPSGHLTNKSERIIDR
jgi:membrane protein DedA with SNARE-associated domain